MIEKLSFEDAVAQFDEIIRRYHHGVSSPGAPDALSHDEAVARLMKLRFTAGEAMQLLRPHTRK